VCTNFYYLITLKEAAEVGFQKHYFTVSVYVMKLNFQASAVEKVSLPARWRGRATKRWR